MRLAKYFTILIILLVSAYTGFWYYQILQITKELNTSYAAKKLFARGVDGDEYYVSFSKVVSYGFPFEFGVKIAGWKEESMEAEIVYKEPIIARYDIYNQKIIASYTGDIIASYRPIQHNFGARLKIKDYFISVDMPITKPLVETLKNLQDPFELVNHFGKIKMGTDKVEIFDLNDGEEFYEKSHEQINISFEPRKYYTSFEDFKDNMPTKVTLDYVVKTEENDAPARRLPTSLFYGFYMFPSDFRAIGRLSLDIRAKEAEDLLDSSDIKLDFQISSKYFDVESCNLEYKSSTQGDDSRFALHNKAHFKSKTGLFDELFREYGEIRPLLSNTFFGKILINEIEYIIGNRKVFNFENLENADYDLAIDLTGIDTDRMMDVNLENFSLISEPSGVRLTSHLNMQKPNYDIKHLREPQWLSEGVVYIQNYQNVIEFFSGYIYRFGKYKFLNDNAREIYSDVNKAFFKKISDHPKSTSKDLSFEYKISSLDLDNTKFGNIKIDQVKDLYQAEMIKRLIEEVKLDNNVLDHMKEIIPDLDENSEIVKKIIPKLKQLKGLNIKPGAERKDKVLNKASDLQENLDSIVPREVRKNIDKKLWNKLLK